MTQKVDLEQEQRRIHNRINIQLSVKWTRTQDAGQAFVGKVSNLSSSGAFVESKKDLPQPGDVLEIAIEGLAPAQILLKTIVRWVNSKRYGLPGFGIEFISADSEFAKAFAHEVKKQSIVNVSDIIENHAKHQHSNVLPYNFGDGYLYFHNPVFKNIRDAFLALGGQYTLEDFCHYRALNMAALPKILESKKDSPCRYCFSVQGVGK